MCYVFFPNEVCDCRGLGLEWLLITILMVLFLKNIFITVVVVPCSFNFICDLKVYLILDEFILAGELQETSKKVCIVLMLSYC